MYNSHNELDWGGDHLASFFVLNLIFLRYLSISFHFDTSTQKGSSMYVIIRLIRPRPQILMGQVVRLIFG